jgi:excisionase family DNA binding protein
VDRNPDTFDADSVAPDLLTVPQAARRLGIHTDTLYRHCKAGKFPPAVQIGGGWRVSVPKLERYLHGDAAPVLAEVAS